MSISCRSLNLYGIKHFCTYVSNTPPPGDNNVQDKLRIVVIHFLGAEDSIEFSFSKEKKSQLKSLVRERNPKVTAQEFDTLIEQINPRFLVTLPIDRIVLALDMFFRAQDRDHCQYEVRYNQDWKKNHQASLHLVFAWKNTSKANFFHYMAMVIYRHKLIMKKVNASYIHMSDQSNILIMAVELHGHINTAAWEEADISDFLKEFVTVKYFPQHDANSAIARTPLSYPREFGKFFAGRY